MSDLTAAISDPCATCPHRRPVVTAGALALELDSKRATWNGVDLGLTHGEFRVIHLLAGNANRYFTYRAIYDVVRSPGFVAGPDGNFSNNVRGVIKRLRRKFEALDPAFRHINNYTGVGYAWRDPAVEISRRTEMFGRHEALRRSTANVPNPRSDR